MILVTGGTGFLGSHLICHLLNKVDKLRAMKRPDSSLSGISRVFSYYNKNIQDLDKRVEWVDADLNDLHSIETCFDNVSHVYHTAGKVSFVPKDRNDLMLINAEGTANIVNIALEKNVRKLVHVSSIAAIGRGGTEDIITEETPWKASGKNSQYAVSKYAAEREVWRGIAEGLDAVIVNPSVILGVGNFNTGSLRLIKLVEDGLKFYTSGVNGFVDVQDVAKIMIALVDSDISGERFIVSSENIHFKSLFEYIAEGLEKSPPPYKAGKLLSEIAWRGSLLLSLITGKPPMITKETSRTANNKYYYSSEKIISTLGYEFIPLKTSIRNICENYFDEQVE